MKSRISILVTLLLVTSSFLLSMQQPPQKPTKRKKLKTWAGLAVNVFLLQGIPRGTNLEKELTLPDDPMPFKGLPKDIQRTIIGLIISGAQAESLGVAAMAINSLARVNKQLNETLNHPLYCLKIIKRLAQKFDVSDQLVCQSLQIEASKELLANQLALLNLSGNKTLSPDEIIAQYNILLQKHIDVNFTYGKNKTTALIRAAGQPNGIMAQLLIQSGANPEEADNIGLTPLQMAQEYSDNEGTIQLIKDAIKTKKK